MVLKQRNANDENRKKGSLGQKTKGGRRSRKSSSSRTSKKKKGKNGKKGKNKTGARVGFVVSSLTSDVEVFRTSELDSGSEVCECSSGDAYGEEETRYYGSFVPFGKAEDEGASYEYEYASWSGDSESELTHAVFPQEENLLQLNQKYIFRERIYKGEDTVVYKALDRSAPSKLLVVKIIDDDRYDDNTPPKEVANLQALQGHRCIPELLDWAPLPTTGCYAIVLPFIYGSSVLSFEHGLVATYMYDVLASLSHVHARGVIYRDVKPDNILFDRRRRRAMLVDYDCAAPYDPADKPTGMYGTHGYMAPEIMSKSKRKKGYSQKIDVYSAGIVMLELLTHVPPTVRRGFPDHSTVEEKLQAKKAKDPEGYDSPAWRLVRRLLAKDPSKRPSAKRALLDPYFADNQDEIEQTRALPKTTRRRRRRTAANSGSGNKKKRASKTGRKKNKASKKTSRSKSGSRSKSRSGSSRSKSKSGSSRSKSKSGSKSKSKSGSSRSKSKNGKKGKTKRRVSNLR